MFYLDFRDRTDMVFNSLRCTCGRLNRILSVYRYFKVLGGVCIGKKTYQQEQLVVLFCTTSCSCLHDLSCRGTRLDVSSNFPPCFF